MRTLGLTSKRVMNLTGISRLFLLPLLAFCVVCTAWSNSAHAKSPSYSGKQLADGFMRTVFGLEYNSWGSNAHQVKKYNGPVRIFIHNLARKNRLPVAKRAVRQINRQIRGLSISSVKSAKSANFHLYIVDRRDYAKTVRKHIFRNQAAHVPGRCLVHVETSRNGISRSSAVIVSDEGEFLFKRCLIEETLQGLGPMNDDKRLVHSVFNDRSRHARFTKFDRYILNMLYDRRVKPGMSRAQANVVLPAVIRDCRKRLH